MLGQSDSSRYAGYVRVASRGEGGRCEWIEGNAIELGAKSVTVVVAKLRPRRTMSVVRECWIHCCKEADTCCKREKFFDC